jgi:hypothetical protein
MGIYEGAGLTAQLSLINRAQKHKYNTTLQIHNDRTL